MYQYLLSQARKLLLLSLLLFIGVTCEYYKPVVSNTKNIVETSKTISAIGPDKYFIIRQSGYSYALKELMLDKDKMTLNGRLYEVDSLHWSYILAENGKFVYVRDKNPDVINEVHIYLKDSLDLKLNDSVVIPLDQIVSIEMINIDKGRSFRSFLFPIIGIPVIITAIVIASKSSCPFISVYDGQAYSLQAESFGGAINRQLERADYIPLRASPVNGEFKVCISNELKEKQYTNFADLIIIEHPANAQAFMDNDRQVYQITCPKEPATALLNNSRDVLNTIRTKDETFCAFDDTAINSGINVMQLSFMRESSAKEAKLIFNLKNSYWFDYLYGEFNSYFGNRYTSFQQKQSQRPAAEMNKWSEKQNIPLKIEMLTIAGWKEIRELKTTGPLANRMVVIPLNIEATPAGPLQVRLSTGFMFWEIDYAAIDYSTAGTCILTRLNPAEAIDENGKSVLKQLADDDSLYLEQPEIGNRAIITYNFSQQPAPGNAFSVILHTKGYYEPIRNYSGKANMTLLRKFRRPSEMPKFSLSNYRKVINKQSQMAVKK